MKILSIFLSTFGALVVSGCVAVSPAERDARQRLQAVANELSSAHGAPVLPDLRPAAPPDDFVRYAVLNHPSVRAAWHDWRAAVESIAPARALPDPRLTFEADITDTLMTFMPGIMFDFMSAGKRAAMAREMTATSETAYRDFVATVLRTAAEARRAWLELAYINEVQRLHHDAAATVEEQLALLNADYTTGRGMGTLGAQMKLLNDAAEHHVHHASLTDRQDAARIRLKSALGLQPTDPDPAWPTATLATTQLPATATLWSRIVAANPELGRMHAMVDMAVAGAEVAGKSRTPDFTLGLMADLKADPLMFRPNASLTLPIWREKIAATIRAAEARRDAAEARLSAAQLNLAAELARMLYMVRQADRMIDYVDQTVLPNLARATAAAEAGYQSGMGAAAMIPESRLMELLMQLERTDALWMREQAVIDVLLMTADIAPVGLTAKELKY